MLIGLRRPIHIRLRRYWFYSLGIVITGVRILFYTKEETAEQSPASITLTRAPNSRDKVFFSCSEPILRLTSQRKFFMAKLGKILMKVACNK